MTARQYVKAPAFKQALEHRLKAASRDGLDFVRRRQRLVFSRFLARVAQFLGEAVTLKGGLVLELRLQNARVTKDVDLRLMGMAADLPERFRELGLLDLGDFMKFDVRPDAAHPELRNPGMKYEGFRFRAQCTLAGLPYGDVFGVDVAFGDPLLGEPETAMTEDVLGFAGIPPPRLRFYPVETHLAEKLHAYTLPRDRPNTRVKDFPDLALLATVRQLDARRVHAALEQTFTFRGTHALPSRVPVPPETWLQPYSLMAERNHLPWKTLDEVMMAVSAFLDPVLTGGLEAIWEPGSWSWRP